MTDTISVTLTPGTGANGQFQWIMSVDGKAQAPGNFPALHAAKNTSPDFSFSINSPDPNLTFASFLVPAGNNEIHHVSDVAGKTNFTFKDHNKNAGDIPYAITFNGGAPKLDPIIDNGGGGTGFYLSDAIIEYGGYLLAAVLLIVFLARQMMRKDAA
ncbi:MAG: hypothetical protein HOP91_07775 [Sphingomonas sp.]|nr:hypothetical protein [Sphingomonas sp.]